MKKKYGLILITFAVGSVIGAPYFANAATMENLSPGGVTQTLYQAGKFQDCEHTYELQNDSYEATEIAGGYRHYICSNCSEEYAYETDPLIYETEGTANEGATNPYLPLWEHMPDGDPHVFWSKEDGEWRVYIYGTHDVDPGIDKYGKVEDEVPNFCSDHYITWSAPVYDLSEWRYEGILYTLDASVTEFRKTAASDCNYNLQNDKYYFAVCRPMAGTTLLEGNKPNDSFEKAVYFNEFFDPSVYIEDGTIYLVSCSGIDKLRSATEEDDMEYELTLDQHFALTDSETGESLPYLYEASSMRYIEEYDLYVYIWSSKVTEDETEHSTMSYAYSQNIESESWIYGGVFSDSSGRYTLDLATNEIKKGEPTYSYGNNHGGIVNANGQWYYFGHRDSGATEYRRQGWIEKINMSYENGKFVIEPHELTSSGAADYLDAYQNIPAGIVCYLTPALNMEKNKDQLTQFVDVTMEESAVHETPVVGLENGSVAGFKYLNFAEEAQLLKLNMLFTQEEGYVDGRVAVYLDGPDEETGTLVASIDITKENLSSGVKESGSDGTEWTWLSTETSAKISGVHAVYFVFSSDEEGTICKFDEFSFEKIAD